MNMISSSEPISWPAQAVRTLNRTLQRIPEDLVLLAARLFPAAVFWQSGQTKLDGWQLNDNARYLFQEEYHLPLLDPIAAAYAAATVEHLFPILLVIGLGTRFAALGLLGMTLVIQFFVYPDAWPTHGTWIALLLLLLRRGAGRWSLDHALGVDLTHPSNVPRSAA